MSYCLSRGGNRAYRLDSLDLEMIKSPSSTSWISNNSSSPSSTLSESSNCPLTISTRKPRTPRKRPNQTYNEAAAILSTAYPKIFPTKPSCIKFTNKNPFSFDPSDLLVPLPTERVGPKGPGPFERACLSPGEINSLGDNALGTICDEYKDDFDTESIIIDEEEIGGGIDCIMGNLGVENEDVSTYSNSDSTMVMNGFCYGYPVALGFDFGFGVRREMRAMRNVDEGDWWRFPSVNVLDLNPVAAKNIIPALEKSILVGAEKKKKKNKKKKKKRVVEIKDLETISKTEELEVGGGGGGEVVIATQANEGLRLKLNYDGVLNAWSDKASPFSGEGMGSEVAGNDVQARLAQIDLFSDNGGIREASVQRYKEKRRNRLFSKKIRYQVRKVNADRRPRMKGRFVRTPNCPEE